jgi:Arc/MetJ-type ribon-helix-helix transcriptional regulator
MDVTKDDRHQVRTTVEETRLLDSLREQKGFTSRSEAIRYCIQQTLENEADAIGSRRHFSRTMNARMDDVTKMVEMYGETQFIALTELFSVLLILLNEGQEAEATDPGKMRLEVIQKVFTASLDTRQIFRTLKRNLEVQNEKLAKAKREQRRKQATSKQSTVASE